MDENKEEYRKVSIIIPVFNEKETLLDIIRQVAAVELPLEKEIVLIDDYSTDGSREMIADGVVEDGFSLQKV